MVGDHTGILGAVVFLILFAKSSGLRIMKSYQPTVPLQQSHYMHSLFES
jgi:hypothetical protein